MKHLFNMNEFLNEGIFSKIRNRDYIKKIEELEENGNILDMVDFLEEILPLTKYPESGKIDLLRDECEEGEYRADPKRILHSLKKYLEKNSIENIIIYGPNHGLNGWSVSDTDLNFSYGDRFAGGYVFKN